MNYIYDILINFQEYLIDIFDWNLNDNITHVRKIPLFKVESNILFDILKNKVEIEKNFLNKIFNKTEVFTDKKVIQIDYACLLSDGNQVIAINLNRKGTITHKSKLLIDEEEEVLEYIEAINQINIDYKIIKKEQFDNFKTRKELKMNDYIHKELDRNIKNKNFEKIKYLYFECFGKKKDDIDEIIFQIKKTLDNNFDSVYHKIYLFFKMTTNK